MIDRVEELEEKVGKLLQYIKTAQGETRRLREANERLGEENERLAKEVEAGEALAKKVGELQAEATRQREALDGFESKENVVRNKINNLIDRMDDIESEIGALEEPAAK